MPQGRIILKSISESRKLSQLSSDGARLLYTWLIPHLDINGCFSGDAEVINGRVLTRLGKTTRDVESYLDELQSIDLIIRYQANGDVFLHVPDFTEKQPSLQARKEAKSRIPLPSQDAVLRTNSGQTPDLFQPSSAISKVKGSKVKGSKGHDDPEILTFKKKDFIDSGVLVGLTKKAAIECWEYYKGEQFTFGSGQPIRDAADACVRWRNNQHKFAGKGEPAPLVQPLVRNADGKTPRQVAREKDGLE